MTAKEVNTAPTTPAYIVQISFPAETARNKTYMFRDADLLAARQAALQKAQLAATEKQAHEVLDIRIQLVEIDRSSASTQHYVIATVVRQRFQRTMFMQNGNDLLKNMQMDALTKKSLPPSLFLSINLEKEDEAVSSLESAWKGLNELESEYLQQQGYPTGLVQQQQ